jgi:hypothetical protein
LAPASADDFSAYTFATAKISPKTKTLTSFKAYSIIVGSILTVAVLASAKCESNDIIFYLLIYKIIQFNNQL